MLKGISRVYQSELVTPASLGYPTSVFYKDSILEEEEEVPSD